MLGIPAPMFTSVPPAATRRVSCALDHALLGAFLTLFSVPMAVVVVVAMLTVHLPYGFNTIKLKGVTAAGPQFGPPGYELNLLYLACLAALVLSGSGPLAVDRYIEKRKRLSAPAAPDAPRVAASSRAVHCFN